VRPSIGLLGLGYPEAYGGTPGRRGFRLIVTEEIARRQRRADGQPVLAQHRAAAIVAHASEA
jgi:alkylation response protein AidB-like acyl-CoA dehydrogenase